LKNNNRLKQSWGGVGAKDKTQATVSLEKAESYEEAFAKIEAATGIHDIDVLVKNFIQAEEKNFTLFKFVNELSNEIENLEQQINDMHSEIDRNKGSGATTDNQRKKALKELEERLSKTEMKAEQLGLEYG
jgi:coiled-coil domain-containing protein 63/114